MSVAASAHRGKPGRIELVASEIGIKTAMPLPIKDAGRGIDESREFEPASQ
jgi:hypothetical protein